MKKRVENSNIKTITIIVKILYIKKLQGLSGVLGVGFLGVSSPKIFYPIYTFPKQKYKIKNETCPVHFL